MKSKLCIILISSAVFVLSLRCFTLSPSPKAPSVANTAQVTTERPSEELASAEATTESNPSETATATEIIANDSTKFPPKITLSGNHDEHFIADKMCYYEGDKFFLMIDEGVDLPGDLANNIALIIDKIEEKTGLTFKTSDDIMGFDCCTIIYGYNPWDGFNFGHKVPIFICVDRDGAGYISHASAEHANIYLDELYSMDLWNSLPQSKDYPSSRQDYVNYYVFAHELTHVLTERHASLTKIMTEGSADYFAEQVINSLSNVSRDFTMSNSSMMLFNSVKDNVTAENAEDIFRNDYIDLSTAERGDEYTLGRLICSYLAQSYGDTFMKDYLSVLADNGFSYTDMVYTHDLVMINKQTDLFKKLFGDDTFIKFAAYYNSLNKTNEASVNEASEASVNEASEAVVNEASEVIVNDSAKFPPKITLSGNHDEHFIADKLCYYEGDKFFLMIDEGVDLPGDLANNIALIIDKLEEKTGLSFMTSDELMRFDCCTIKYGHNPWDGFNFGHKIPIFIFVDRDGAGYVSYATSEHANIYMRELYSKDVLNSTGSLSLCEDYIDYYKFAHVLTYVLTERHATLTKIMSAGSADYFAEQVINSLRNVSRDFAMSSSSMILFNSVKDTVTAENAEAIFRNDYIDLSTAERGDEYTLGRLICSYLAQSYGDTFMKDYLSVLADNGFAYTDMVYNPHPAMINKQTDLFKKLFGDDTFTKFAAYYNSLN